MSSVDVGGLFQQTLPSADFAPGLREKWGIYLTKHLAAANWTKEVAGEKDWEALFKGFLDAMTHKRMGMIMSGVCGVGKTSFVEATGICTRVIHCILQEEVGWLDFMDYPDSVRELMECNILIDDLGAENEVNQYGVRRDLVGEFIGRYELRGKGRLFITTNLTGAQVQERYQDRIVSRLKNLCVPVQFTGKDKRKWLV